MNPGTGFVDAEGTPLFYRFNGSPDNPVLMLSNSLGTDCSMWNAQVNVISAKYRILRYDTRGHGASSGAAAGDAGYGIDRLGRDVLALLDTLKIERVHFCGLSMGGMTGMWLGANAPQRLDRLVLANTAAWIGPPDMWASRAELVLKEGMQAIADGVMKRWFTARCLEENAAVVARGRAMLLATPPAGYVRACMMLRDMDLRPMLSRISAPALVIAGSQDAATPVVDSKFLVENIRGARMVELDAAHLSNLELPEAFSEAVQMFVSGK